MSIATRSLELAPKKEGNFNIIATKIMWLHPSTDIPISSPITFTYYFISNGLLFQYIKPYSSIIENGLSYIALLKNSQTVILLSSHLLGISFLTLYCWEAHQLLSHSSFDSYWLISHLLGYSLSWFNSVRIWITSYSLAITSQWQDHPTDQVWLIQLLQNKLAFRVNKKLSKWEFRLLEQIWDPRKLGQLYFVEDKV